MKLLVVFACMVTTGLCMPGGWSQQDLTDGPTKQKFMDMLTMLSNAPSSDGTKNNLGLIALPDSFQLVGVKTQVVAGMNYNFTMNIGGRVCHIVYFEQVWTDTHSISTDTCNIKVTATPAPLCAGCPAKQDPTDMKYMTTLMSMVHLPANGDVKINSVTTQVVAGIKYMYDLTIAGRHCLFDYVEQAWMKTNTVIKDTCHLSGQQTRQIGVRVGGYTPQDSTLPKWTSMLNTLMSKKLLFVGANADVRVLAVSQQVVSGMNYRFTVSVDGKVCTFTYYTQSWTNTHEIHADVCNLSTPPSKRQLGGGGLLGGWRATTDSDKDAVQKCLSQSLDMVNARSNAMFRLVEDNMHAMAKTVQGMEYKLTFNTMESGCMNSGDSQGLTAMRCLASNTHNMGTWESVCWSRPWLQDGESFKVTSVKMADKKPSEPVDDVPSVEQADSNVLKEKVPVDHVLTGIQQTVLELADTNNLKDSKLVDNALDTGKKLLKGGINLAEQLIGEDKVKLLGGDMHDLIQHGEKLLGGDGHDLINHAQKILGGDGHDMMNRGQKLLGGDGHDMMNHGQKLLGGDGHDMMNHGQKLMGGDGHDMMNHGQKILGGDGHDMMNHGQKLLGGDGHDMMNHGQKLLGGDGHDMMNHGQKILGGDGHDMMNHGQKILGGDGHDMMNHGQKLLGGDGHDMMNHGQKLLGGDGHDYIQHAVRVSMLGQDGHDQMPHGKEQKPMIGGDGHDQMPHGEKEQKPMIGGDGHDYCHIGMFNDFKKQYNKLYGSQKEEDKRYMTFCDNMRAARKLQQTEKGSARYGATKFADLTEAEFKQYVGKPWDLMANQDMKRADIPKGAAPKEFDWRVHGAVTAVKNQGSCGSCWAFSTTGNIEGQWAIKKKKLISLSEQELVDCDKLDEGCNGGLPSNAYKEIERLGGLETETEYSYKGEDEKCEFKKQDVRVYINDSVSISSNETEMASWLAANGPISIGINAFAMQFYMGGISHPWKIFCNPKSLDHGVLIVGYGVQSGEPYWIVKNSWGPDWGEKGYYLVYRGSGVCGLNTMCTSAVVD